MPFFSHTRHIYLAGVLLTIATAWYSLGYHHPDEHYQIWEFAKYKLGESPAADLPWEFQEQMRPGLQPFLAYCAISAARLVGMDDPFFQVFLMRFLAGLMAFLLYWKWCDALAPSLKDGGRILRLCAVFFWMMPYLNVRFSSENMSAITFLSGLLLLYPQPMAVSRSRLLGAGLLLGLSFFFRYQIAFAGIGLGAWLLMGHKLPLRGWVFLAFGAAIAIVLGLAADGWLYGNWVFAPYNYFALNIFEDKAAGFGVSPWWWYFTEMPVLLLPPVSLFLFWFMGAGIRRAPWHVFVWCLVPFVLGHSFVGHKESRFLLPMIFPIIYLAALGWDRFSEKGSMPKWLKGALVVTIAINLIALIPRSLYPANDRLATMRFMRSYSVEHPEAVVYWEMIGPTKKETLTPHFYQSPWMNIQVADSLEQLNNPIFFQPKPGDLICFRSRETSFVPNAFATECVYRWFPDWVLRFNPIDWQDRTPIWSVFRIKNESSE